MILLLMIPLLLIVSPVIVLPGFAAQAISIRASVDKTSLTINDHFTLSVIIEGSNIGSLSDPELPELAHFSIISSSQGSNFSWINGKISVSKSIQYIVKPLDIGTFTIPRIIVSQGKNKYSTDPITVTVSKSLAKRQPRSSNPSKKIPGGRSPSATPSKGSKTKNKGNIFIENRVDKKKVFVNEQIILTFGLYYRIELWQNPSYSQSPFEGFWEVDLEKQSPKIEFLGGKKYRTQEIKMALFPISPGVHTIGPATLTYQTGFFSRPRTLKTEPISIEVLPLPKEGKPQHFKGTVGNYTLKAHVDNKKCVQNEPVTLHVQIKGTGHIESIPEPVLIETEGIQKYDTDVKQTMISKEKVSGEKTFDFLLIPRKSGDLQIPSVHFSFFDPKNKRYVPLTSQPIEIFVAPTALSTVSTVSATQKQSKNINKQDVTIVQEDIRFIRTNLKGLKKNNFFFENKIYWCIIIFPFLGLILCFWLDRRTQKIQADKGYARLKQALRKVKKNLQKARLYDKKGEEKEFYAAIAKSLTEYIADKFNMQAAGLTNHLITQELQKIGAPEETTKNLQNCFDDCDYARFAPSNGDAKARKKMLKKVEQVILQTEKAVKGKV